MIKYPSLSSHVLPEIDECWDQVQYQPVGKSAAIWIYGEYGEVRRFIAVHLYNYNKFHPQHPLHLTFSNFQPEIMLACML